MMDQGGDVGDQLTLSFQGQVYVFDSVPPEKVHQLIQALFLISNLGCIIRALFDMALL